MEPKEGNRLIAEFMGLYMRKGDTYPYGKPNAEVNYREAEYHTSWDWLHPVIEKIGKMYDEGRVPLYRNLVLFELTIFTNIETVWAAVIQFIQNHE